MWSAGLPERLRDMAVRLVPAGDSAEDGYRWVHPDGKPINELEDPSRRSDEGTTPGGLLAALGRDAIDGAVLYPSAAALAYAHCKDSALLSAVLDVYNEWILAVAAAEPDRLKAIALLNVDDPAGEVRTMCRLADRGAAGFVVPSAPGQGRRYDQRRYEVLWRTAVELDRPLSLLIGTGRATEMRTAGREAAVPQPDATPTAAAVLAFHATAVFPTRRSLTAIIFAGVFERHPALRIGAVGFGAAWAAYAMARADEMYEVRPERAGPPTRVPEAIRVARSFGDDDPDVGAIAGDDRSGTRGMAPEGVGYYFPPEIGRAHV